MAAYPDLEQIGVEIDLLGAEAVGGELLDATLVDDHREWPASTAGYVRLYGQQPGEDLLDFLHDAATSLRRRFQEGEHTRDLWTALKVERIGSQVRRIEAAVTDPAAAVRLADSTPIRTPVPRQSVQPFHGFSDTSR